MSSVGKQDEPLHGNHPRNSEVRRRLAAIMPLAENIRDIHGVSTAVFEGGEGSPMVLLHSIGEFAAVWQPVIAELMKTHHLVVPDLPGQGASEVAGEFPDAEGVLRWLDELIRQTCDSPPVLVGHLLGGAIAARYAVEHGERISRLVLVDTLGLEWYRPSLRFAVPMMGFIARPSAKSQDRFFDKCFFDRDQVRSETGQNWQPLMDYALDRARTPSVQAAVRRLVRTLGMPPIRSEDLSSINVPTTLIHGRYDLQVRQKTAEQAASRYGWKLHVIEECRDDPAFEQPSAFIDALHSALDLPNGLPNPQHQHQHQHQHTHVEEELTMTANPRTGPPVREAWDLIAPAFDEYVTPENIACGQEVIRRANLGPGTAFLDVAAGSGALSIPAARLGADVLAVDISPGMIEHLVKRARSEALPNLQARVMDGCALDLDDDTFDVAASQHGVSIFPDLMRGLLELRRVTKPGGQVIVAAFGDLRKAEFLGFFLSAVQAAAPGIPSLHAGPPPLPFQLADPIVFRDKLTETGLSEVAVETVTWDMQIGSAQDLWNTVTSSNPIGAGINASLSNQERSDAIQILAGMLRERSAGQPGAVLHTEINIGTARK